MRLATFNAAPFMDTSAGNEVGFLNLPIEFFEHRGVVPAGNIPAAPPDGTNTPQTALFGASYIGAQSFAISPDTPAKTVPDDTSYSAPSGGILARMSLQVVGNEQGQQLFMNLDDDRPNSPGSAVSVFNGFGIQEIILDPLELADGFHGEGVTCVAQNCTMLECPPTPTPTPCGADVDCDGVPDGSDNCPNWPNTNQGLPPWPVPPGDPDCDGFSSAVENSVGTAANLHCGVEAWPADIDQSTYSDIGDLRYVTNDFGRSVPPASPRYNIAPDPVDGFIDTADIGKMTSLFALGCTTPPTIPTPTPVPTP